MSNYALKTFSKSKVSRVSLIIIHELLWFEIFELKKICFFPFSGDSSGAQVYYLRNVLQNLSDEQCLIVLRHIADAMSDDSVLLIDEPVMPKCGANQHATYIDLVTMCLFGSKKRIMSQWSELVANADNGLMIRRTIEYCSEYHSNIIEVVKSS